MAERDLADELRRDRAVGWKVFGAVGTIIVIMTALYLPSDEIAGIVMLVVAALLSFFCGVFLWRASGPGAEAGGAPGDEDHEFLPESSPWPFGIGLGATLVLNGLLIGTWFLVPGVAVLGASLGGFARQSRHRFDR